MILSFLRCRLVQQLRKSRRLIIVKMSKHKDLHWNSLPQQDQTKHINNTKRRKLVALDIHSTTVLHLILLKIWIALNLILLFKALPNSSAGWINSKSKPNNSTQLSVCHRPSQRVLKVPTCRETRQRSAIQPITKSRRITSSQSLMILWLSSSLRFNKTRFMDWSKVMLNCLNNKCLRKCITVQVEPTLLITHSIMHRTKCWVSY